MIQYDLNLAECGKHIKKFLKRRDGAKILEAKYPWFLNPPVKDKVLHRELMTAFRHLSTHRGAGTVTMGGHIPGRIEYLSIRQYGKEVFGLGDDPAALNFFTEAILAIDGEHHKRALEKAEDKRQERRETGVTVTETEAE